MFDEPPANLPVEPAIPAGGPPPSPPLEIKTPPRPASDVPKLSADARPAQGGMQLPKKQEPEDIFGNLEPPAVGMDSSESDPLAEPKPSNGMMRYLVYALGGLTGVAVLAVGGFFFYQTFIATAPAAPSLTDVPPPEPPTAPTVPTPAQAVLPSESPMPTGQEEAPPVVPPTPPSNIPPPTPVQAPLDSDGDGLDDGQEAALGTNINAADTDGDGLSDREETQTYSTDPLRADTDGDGLTDADEVKVWKTKPSEADTDGDTYSDGQEVQNGFNPNGPGKLSTN